MKKLLTALILIISVTVFAQEKTITGTVIDESGEPFFAATVVIKRLNNGTVTDMDGKYTLRVKEGDVVNISYIGTKPKKFTVTAENVYNVTLKYEDQQLNEVVVVGYGKVKKSDLTGSVSSIKGEDLTKVGTVGLDQALAGRASGVVVTQNSGAPGSGSSVTIRGISTISNSQPLYVIDGVPIENDAVGTLNSSDEGSGSMNPLSLINPADIESIEILKDASGTAIYGSRGANGVVLVTTKMGAVGKGVINISTESGVAMIPNTIKVFDGNQYWISRNEAQINGGQNPISETRLDSARAGQIQTTDWLKTITRTATLSNTNIDFSGGNKQLRFLSATNILKQTGSVDKTDFNRIQTRLNLDSEISKVVRIGTRITYSAVSSESQATNTNNFENDGTSNVIRKALNSNPSQVLISDDEQIEGEDNVTPFTYIENNTWNTNMNQFLGNIFANFQVNDAVSFKTTFTYQNRSTIQRFYQNNMENVGIILANNRKGWARTSDAVNVSTTNTNEFHYNKGFKDHDFNIVLGQSSEWRKNESLSTSNYGFANDILTWHAPQTATFYDPDQVTYVDSRLISFFGRVNYNYLNKFLFTLTGRYDGSSKFAVNNKWAFFPAGALGYKISQEKFMKNIKAISSAKLRVSYGKVGNQAIREYQSLAQLDSGQFVFGADGESVSPIYYSSQIPNNNLKWETTDQFDAGIDMSFLRNKYTLTADYYNKHTTDLLIANNKIAAQSGHDTFTQNFGAIRTEGFEAAFGLRVIEKPGIRWNVDLNMAVVKAVITDLVTDNIQSGISFGRVTTGTQRLIIGEEVGTFFGWKTAGVSQFNDFEEFRGLSQQEQIDLYNQNRTATFTYASDYQGGRPVNASMNRPGEQLYVDSDGDLLISEADKQIIGHAQPDFSMGINNTFQIGNVDISFLIDTQIGQEIANVGNWNLLTYASNQQLEIVKNAWTPYNQSTTQPKVTTNSGWGNTLPFSDRYVEDGSFIRLQNFTIGYTIPKIKNIDALRIYASGSSLYTLTNYTGFNPDVNLNANNNTAIGHDNSGYPVSRSIRFGISMKL